MNPGSDCDPGGKSDRVFSKLRTSSHTPPALHSPHVACAPVRQFARILADVSPVGTHGLLQDFWCISVDHPVDKNIEVGKIGNPSSRTMARRWYHEQAVKVVRRRPPHSLSHLFPVERCSVGRNDWV